MKATVRKITKHISFYTIMILMCLMVFNKVFYTHSHIKANGIIISHAHPFQKSDGQSPTKKHHHTSFEFSVIDSFQLFWIGFFGILLSYFGFIRLKNYQNYFSNCRSTSLIALNDRAPPYFN